MISRLCGELGADCTRTAIARRRARARVAGSRREACERVVKQMQNSVDKNNPEKKEMVFFPDFCSLILLGREAVQHAAVGQVLGKKSGTKMTIFELIRLIIRIF